MRPLSVPRSLVGLRLALRAPGQLARLAAHRRAIRRRAGGLQEELAMCLAGRQRAGDLERVLRAVTGARVGAGCLEAVVLAHAWAEDVGVRLAAATVVARDLVVDPHPLDAVRSAVQLDR